MIEPKNELTSRKNLAYLIALVMVFESNTYIEKNRYAGDKYYLYLPCKYIRNLLGESRQNYSAKLNGVRCQNMLAELGIQIVENPNCKREKYFIFESSGFSKGRMQLEETIIRSGLVRFTPFINFINQQKRMNQNA